MAKNLLAKMGSGAVQPAETAAHHIVAHSQNNLHASASRAILNRLGIGISVADNGVFLLRFLSISNSTGAQVHSVIDSSPLYHQTVLQRLRNAEPGGPSAVRAALQQIARELEAGTFPVR